MRKATWNPSVTSKNGDLIGATHEVTVTRASSMDLPDLFPANPMQLRALRSYNFSVVSSAMQKAIRRGDAALAGYWALELWSSDLPP
jgi:hypothetical protein